MTAEMTWAHVGDLHADSVKRFASIDRLEAIVDKRNGLGDAIDVMPVPGRDPDPADLPSRQRPPVALDRDAHLIGAWLERGIMGIGLGPYRDGCAS